MTVGKVIGGYDGDVKWIPVRSAAKLLGVSRQRVSRLCREGSLVSVLYDGTRLVSQKSVEVRIAARRLLDVRRG